MHVATCVEFRKVNAAIDGRRDGDRRAAVRMFSSIMYFWWSLSGGSGTSDWMTGAPPAPEVDAEAEDEDEEDEDEVAPERVTLATSGNAPHRSGTAAACVCAVASTRRLPSGRASGSGRRTPST